MDRFSNHLRQLKEQGRHRTLNLPFGIDLTSNDYLGFSTHPALRDKAREIIDSDGPVGSGGSRLLRGHTESHENLETFAAEFFGCGKALFFATGFQANYALFTTLPARQDTIIFDSLIHASARDGIQAAHARHIKVRHNDLNAFEEALKKAQGQKWIAVESVYSMDGDIAPVSGLLSLADQYDAFLIVDEAHATGIFGPDGKGFTGGLPHERLITLHTCGKALGVAGGLVCAAAEVTDYLVNKARPFIYSTAPMPLQAAAGKTGAGADAGRTGTAADPAGLARSCQPGFACTGFTDTDHSGCSGGRPESRSGGLRPSGAGL